LLCVKKKLGVSRSFRKSSTAITLSLMPLNIYCFRFVKFFDQKRVLEEGEAGVIHKNRGRQPSHTLPASLKQKIVALYQSDDYRGCNDTHFTELLAQRQNLYVSTSTVQRILRAAGIPATRKHRAPRSHRSRRRMPQAGLLWQMDASTFG